ncbi:hypothetical protein OG384_03110 [Streptomyces sp. NBC_01324]|uniref:hypothetical protein n=1 Tax=Streptomyces sp. NBC_01324 TaxID=2903826 RepID=UPI002E0E7F81|nr:hypothetical protein OG384_03110 [Streptomyces sp. NBC_01324]
MRDPTTLRLRHALEHAALVVKPGVDQAIVHAFERILAGQPEHTGGALTVRALCMEAGISRATYYRSPLAKVVAALLREPDAPRPQTDTLTAEITRLKGAERALRSRHAAEREELRATIAAYAQHIQALTLRLTELEDANGVLRRQIQQPDPIVTSLRQPR